MVGSLFSPTGLEMLAVFVFRKTLCCVDCGRPESSTPEIEVRSLRVHADKIPLGLAQLPVSTSDRN